MGETRQIAVIVIIALVLGVIGLVIISAIPSLLQGDLAVDSYEATLYQNGTLQEQYIYQVQYFRRVPDAVPFVGSPPGLCRQ